MNDAFGPNPSFGDQKLRSPSAMLRPSTLVALHGEARLTLLCDFDVDVSHLILLGRVMSERRRSGVSERMSPCPPIVRPTCWGVYTSRAIDVLSHCSPGDLSHRTKASNAPAVEEAEGNMAGRVERDLVIGPRMKMAPTL